MLGGPGEYVPREQGEQTDIFLEIEAEGANIITKKTVFVVPLGPKHTTGFEWEMIKTYLSLHYNPIMFSVVSCYWSR